MSHDFLRFLHWSLSPISLPSPGIYLRYLTASPGRWLRSCPQGQGAPGQRPGAGHRNAESTCAEAWTLLRIREHRAGWLHGAIAPPLGGSGLRVISCPAHTPAQSPLASGKTQVCATFKKGPFGQTNDKKTRPQGIYLTKGPSWRTKHRQTTFPQAAVALRAHQVRGGGGEGAGLQGPHPRHSQVACPWKTAQPNLWPCLPSPISYCSV